MLKTHRAKNTFTKKMSETNDGIVYTWILRCICIVIGIFTIVSVIFLLLNLDFSLKNDKVQSPTDNDKLIPSSSDNNTFKPTSTDTFASVVIEYIERNLSNGLCTDIANIKIPVHYIPTFIVPVSNKMFNACDIYDNSMLLFFLCAQNERRLASKVANSFLGSAVMAGWWPSAANSDVRILHFQGLQERYSKITGRADYGQDNSLRAGAEVRTQSNCFLVMALARFVTYYSDVLDPVDLILYVRCAYDTFVAVVYPRLCDKGKYKGYFDLNNEKRVSTTDNIAVNAAGKQLLTLIDIHGQGDMNDKKNEIEKAVAISLALVKAMYYESTMSNECFPTPQLAPGTEAQLFTSTVPCNNLINPDCECGEQLDCYMTLATESVTWAQLNERMIDDVNREVRLATWLTTNVSIVDTDAVDTGCGPITNTPCTTSYINMNQVFNGQKFSSQGSQIMWSTTGQSVMMLYDVFVNRLEVKNTYVEGSLKRTYAGLQKVFESFGTTGIPATFCKQGSWQFEQPPGDKVEESVQQVLKKQRNKMTLSGFNELNYYKYTHLSSTIWCTLGISYVAGLGDNGYNIFSKLNIKPKDFKKPVGIVERPVWVSDYIAAHRVSCFFEDLTVFPKACDNNPILIDTSDVITAACHQLSTITPDLLNSPPASYAKLKVTTKFNWGNVCLPSPYFNSCSGQQQALGVTTSLTIARKDGGCSL
jgi:hypothetical protein